MTRKMLLAVLPLILANSTLQAQVDDIKMKMDNAKKTYRTEMESISKAYHDWLMKREDTARQNGDKKSVDVVKADREAFKTSGAMAKTTPDAIKSKPNLAKTALETAYKNAIKEYTRTRKDELADALEKEYDSFRAGKLDLLEGSGIQPPKIDLTTNPNPNDPKTITPKIAPKPVKFNAEKIFDPTIWKNGNFKVVPTVDNKEGCVVLVDRSVILTTANYSNCGMKIVASFSAEAKMHLYLSWNNRSDVSAMLGNTTGSKLTFGSVRRSQQMAGRIEQFEPDQYHTFEILANNNVYETILNGKSINKQEMLGDGSDPNGIMRIFVYGGNVKVKEVTLVPGDKKK